MIRTILYYIQVASHNILKYENHYYTINTMKIASLLLRALALQTRFIKLKQPFCTQSKITQPGKQNKNIETQTKKLNSIMPATQQGFAYGHYFPKNWSQQRIKSVLDPTSKDIQRVSIVKTNVGQHSGKVLIKFKNDKVRSKYIQKYNQDYIITDSQSQKVVILPFQLKTQEKKKQFLKDKNLKNPVRISNLDFDITQQQLRKIASGYGKISHIELSLRQSGINRGFATLYFERHSDAQIFLNFINDYTYKDRKLKAHIIQKPQKKEEKQFLSVPTFIFQANIQLMKKMKAKQFQDGQNIDQDKDQDKQD